MIHLDEQAWARLYREVLVIALRLTHTRDTAQQATQIDRAREATQRACFRCMRIQPAGLDTMEALRSYLVWRVRSELSHASEEQEARQKLEGAAAIEQATAEGTAGASAEVIHLDAFAATRKRERAARAIKECREALADDRIALGTIDCIARGKTKPHDQAEILECSVEEIHAARKRRKRVLAKILAALDAEDERDAKE